MGFMDNWKQESTYSTASGQNFHYVVLQVTLNQKAGGSSPFQRTKQATIQCHLLAVIVACFLFV